MDKSKFNKNNSFTDQFKNNLDYNKQTTKSTISVRIPSGSIAMLGCIPMLGKGLVKKEKFKVQKSSSSMIEKQKSPTFVHKNANDDIMIMKIIKKATSYSQELKRKEKLVDLGNGRYLLTIDEKSVYEYLANDIKTKTKGNELYGLRKEILIRAFFRMQSTQELPRLFFSTNKAGGDIFYELDAIFYTEKQIKLPNRIFYRKDGKDNYIIESNSLIIFEVKASWMPAGTYNLNETGDKLYTTAGMLRKFISNCDKHVEDLKKIFYFDEKNVNIYKALVYNGTDSIEIEEEIHEYKNDINIFYYHEFNLEKFLQDKSIEETEFKIRRCQEDAELKLKKEKENFEEKIQKIMMKSDEKIKKEREDFQKQSDEKIKKEREDFQKQSDMKIKESEMKIKESDMKIKESEMKIKESEIKIKESEMKIKQEREESDLKMKTEIENFQTQLKKEKRSQERYFACLLGIITVISICLAFRPLLT